MTNKIYSCKGVPQLSSLAFIAFACEMTVPKLDPEQCSVHLHKRSILSPVWIRRYYQVFRWPIKYPAARGRHNCKVLHYCLCVRNDGAQAGSRAVFSTSSQVFNIITSMYLVSSILVANEISSCKAAPQLSSLALLPLRVKWRCPSWNQSSVQYIFTSIQYFHQYVFGIKYFGGQ